MSFIAHDQKIKVPDDFVHGSQVITTDVIAWLDTLHYSNCNQTYFRILVRGQAYNSVVAHWSFVRPTDDRRIIDPTDPDVEKFIENEYKKAFMENLLWFIRPHFLFLNPSVAINVAARFAASVLSGISIGEAERITEVLNYYPGITQYLHQIYEVSWSVRTGQYVEYANNPVGRYLVQRIHGGILELVNGMRNLYMEDNNLAQNLHYSERTLRHWGVDMELNDQDRTADNFSHTIGRRSRRDPSQKFFGLERAHFECPGCQVQSYRPIEVSNHMVAAKCETHLCCGEPSSSQRNRRAHKVAFCREKSYESCNYCENPSINCHCVNNTTFIVNYAAGLVRDNLSNGNRMFTQDHLAIALNMLEALRMPSYAALLEFAQFDLADRSQFDQNSLNGELFHWNWPEPKISNGMIHMDGNVDLHIDITEAMSLLPARFRDRQLYTEAVSLLVGYAGGTCVRVGCQDNANSRHDVKLHPICNICSKEKSGMPDKFSGALLVRHLHGHFFYKSGETSPINDGSLVCPLCCQAFPERCANGARLTWGHIFAHITSHHISIDKGWHINVPCDRGCDYFGQYLPCEHRYKTYMDYLTHQFICHISTPASLSDLLYETKLEVQRVLFEDYPAYHTDEEHAQAFDQAYAERIRSQVSDGDNSSDGDTIVPSDEDTIVPSDDDVSDKPGDLSFSGDITNTTPLNMEIDDLTVLTPSEYAGGGIMTAAPLPSTEESNLEEGNSTMHSPDPLPTASSEVQEPPTSVNKGGPPVPITRPFVGSTGEVLQYVHPGVTNTTRSMEDENEYNLIQAQRLSLAHFDQNLPHNHERDLIDLEATQAGVTGTPQPGHFVTSNAGNGEQRHRLEQPRLEVRLGQSRSEVRRLLAERARLDDTQQREQIEENEVEEQRQRQLEALRQAEEERRRRPAPAATLLPGLPEPPSPMASQPLNTSSAATVTTASGLRAGSKAYTTHHDKHVKRLQLEAGQPPRKSNLKTPAGPRSGAKTTRFAPDQSMVENQSQPVSSSHYTQGTGPRATPPRTQRPPGPALANSTPTSTGQPDPRYRFHPHPGRRPSMSPIREAMGAVEEVESYSEHSDEDNSHSEEEADQPSSGQGSGRSGREDFYGQQAEWGGHPYYQSEEQDGDLGSRRKRYGGGRGGGHPSGRSDRPPPPSDHTVWCEHPNCFNSPPFANQLQLTLHVRTKHKCPERGCEFSSMSVEQMAMHHLERHGSKKEYCTVCKIEVPDLATHNSSHSLCPICDEPFSSRQAVKQHVVTCRDPVDASQNKASASASSAANFALDESFSTPPSIVGRHRQSSLLSAVIALTEKVGLNAEDKGEIQSRIKEHVAQEEVARERAKYGSFNIYQADPLLLMVPTFGDINRYPKDENFRSFDRQDVFKAIIPTTPGEKIAQFNRLERLNLRVWQLVERCNLTERVAIQVLCDWLHVDVREYLTSHTHAESTSQLTYKQILTVLQRDFTAIKMDEFEKYVHTATIQDDEIFLNFCSKVHRWLRTIALSKSLEQRETYIEKHRRSIYLANLPKVIKNKLKDEEDKLCVEYTAKEIRLYYISYIQKNGEVAPELERTFRPRDFGIRRVEAEVRQPRQASKKGPRPTDVSTSFQDWEEADQPLQPQTGGYDRPNKRGGRRQNPPTQPRAEPAGQRSKQPSRQAPPQPESEEDEPRYDSPVLASGPKRDKNKRTSGKRPASEKGWVAPQYTTPGIGKAISPSGKRTRAKREEEMNAREDLRSNRDNRNQRPKVTYASTFPVSEDEPQEYREPRGNRQRNQYEISTESIQHNKQPGRAPPPPPMNQSAQAPMKGILKAGSDGRDRKWSQPKEGAPRNSTSSGGGFDRNRDDRPQGFSRGSRQGDRQRPQQDSPRPQAEPYRASGPSRATAESMRKREVLTELGFHFPEKGIVCFSCLEAGHTSLQCTVYRYDNRPATPATEPHTYKQNGRLVACGFHHPQDCQRPEAKRSESKTNRIRRQK